MPFVDHELQHAVWPGLGQHPALARGKRLLVDSLPAPLPPAVAGQPKRGFTLPFATWIDSNLAAPTRDGLSALAEQGWITRAAADGVWSAWQRRQTHWSQPWGLAILGRFLAQAP